MCRNIIAVMLVVLSIMLAGCSADKYLNAVVPAASKVLDSNGELITFISQENRLPVTLDNISPYMKQAVIAIEDSRFYSHHGIDPVGITRALYRNIRARSVVEGGSTITQQLAKNLFLDPRRTAGRKLEELVLTIELERKYTKNEILGMYLNEIYFGQGAYGIESASRTYFNKPAKDLGLAESAMLAGIPRAPSIYNPSANPAAARERQVIVLDRMAALGMVDEKKAEQAKNQYLQPLKAPAQILGAPYFTSEIIRQLEQKYQDDLETVYSGGLTIYTTLDKNMQDAAEKAMADGLRGKDPNLNGALVAIEPKTGQIKAMVGGKDYIQSQFNRALSKIQPGSTFKPFLYAAAVDHGYTAGTVVTCEQVSFTQAMGNPYQPKDFQGGYHNRPFTLKEALYTSDNVVAVKLNDMVGPSVAAAYARRMGVASAVQPVLSLPLGTSEVTPLEMAGAYSTLANGGLRNEPYYISKITDSNGRILEEHRPQPERALDERTCYIITDMLTGVLKAGGTAPDVYNSVKRPAAGKTGTTENFKDAWFIGYTPDLAASVYVGYDEKTKGSGQTGSQAAAPVWSMFVKEALKEVPAREFPAPQGIVKVNICADDGMLAGGVNTRAIEAAFIKGTEPTEICPGAGAGVFIEQLTPQNNGERDSRWRINDLDSYLPGFNRLKIREYHGSDR
ncbi:transglycosylase domain-containing protein [Pelotomaculum propionicicum]|uniref:transglycosylase domain-containing protein n=1 Tax=Pelotomaculum propionicicum TaxID=258475 RepID=UPI003B81B694